MMMIGRVLKWILIFFAMCVGWTLLLFWLT